jgi:hypothetical protein
LSPNEYGETPRKAFQQSRTITVCRLLRAVIFVYAMAPAVRARLAHQNGTAQSRTWQKHEQMRMRKTEGSRAAGPQNALAPHWPAIRTFQKQHVEFQKLTSLILKL